MVFKLQLAAKKGIVSFSRDGQKKMVAMATVLSFDTLKFNLILPYKVNVKSLCLIDLLSKVVLGVRRVR